MNTHTITVAKDFSTYPAGRYEIHGAATGEGFRRRLLTPALKQHDHVTVDLDGTLGSASSFLEEAFGGLVREENFTEQYLQNHMAIKSQRRPSLLALINQYIHNAQLQKQQTT